MGSQDDNLRLSTTERLKGMLAAKRSAEELQASGGTARERGPQSTVASAEVQALIERWPDPPKLTARKFVEHYGLPHELTPTKLFWYRVGPWSKMEITADEVIHNFPTPHTDFLTQYVDYPVTTDKAADVVAFDGSVVLDRNIGQIGARCDSEAANTLTLNLVVEIMEGRREVADARGLLAESLSAFLMGRDAPYAERLLFTPVSDPDPDEPAIGPAMLDQIGEKIKDLVGSGDPVQ